MPPRPQVLDSLWLCLCPSYRPGSPYQQWRAGAILLRTRTHEQQRGFRQCTALAATDQEHPKSQDQSAASQPDHDISKKFSDPHSKLGRVSSSVGKYVRAWQQDNFKPRQKNGRPRPHKPSRNLTDMPEDQLIQIAERKLKFRSSVGDLPGARTALERLLKLGRLTSDAGFYASMIEANCSTEEGSLDAVYALLTEMDERGIRPTQAVYEALLKVTAIHPSHTLRQSVLDAMRDQWIDLKVESWQHVVCGLLRDRQIELALQEMEKMQSQQVAVPVWLLDLTIHILNDIDEFDALYPRLAKRYEDRENQPSQILNLSVMSRAAKCLHHQTVKLIWDSQVAFNLLNPSTGLCTAVLDTAARAGDPVLATDVFRILGNRSSPLSVHHYEALVEAHMTASEPDLYKAFSIISIMGRSGKITSTGDIAVPIQQFLRRRGDLLDEAWKVLSQLKDHGWPIPIILPNAILEAAVKLGNIDWALDSYKRLHGLYESMVGMGANTATFNVLLKGCYEASRKDLAMFVAAEMLALKVQPDALTYDRLILACINGDGGGDGGRKRDPEEIAASRRRSDHKGGAEEAERESSSYGTPAEATEDDKRDLRDAFRYLGEMQSRGWWPRNGTLNALGVKAVDCDDNRAHSLIRWMERLGSDAYLIKERLQRRQPAAVATP